MHRKSNAISMFRIVFAFVAAIGLLVAFSGTAQAQAKAVSTNVNYYDNANNPNVADAEVRIVNPGTTNGFSGDVCANIYVFSADQQLAECCSCDLTPDGSLALSVNHNLTSNPLTTTTLVRGEIKIIPSVNTHGCNAGSSYTVSGQLRAWITHILPALGTATEQEFSAAPAAASELGKVQSLCALINFNGSTAGQCSCRGEGG